MFEIKDNYVDNNGNVYNLRNVNFDIFSQVMEFGELVAQTQKDYIAFMGEEDYVFEGAYIHKSNYDPKIALKIYKDWAKIKMLAQFTKLSAYNHLSYDDYKIVSALLKKQKDIKLTKFPTGIVTFENFVIGQEIPYYEGHIDLSKEIINLKDNIKDKASYIKNHQMIIHYYQKIINILEELTKNDIYYMDLHPKNFVVKDESLKLIDFEKGQIKFNYTKEKYEEYVREVNGLFNVINSTIGIDFIIEKNNSFNDMREELLIKSKKFK